MHHVTHSVMFHHFHDSFHEPAQGSLSAPDFRRMILWLRDRYSILGAKEYSEKARQGGLDKSDICFSFDDALKCQYDIAIPVLNEFGIDAFFFVYSSAFGGSPDFLEIYRYFRTTEFDDIEDFYRQFFELVKDQDVQSFNEHYSAYSKMSYLSAFPFYTENDKWFRYIRDQYLVGNQYHEIMQQLMKAKGFDIESAKQKLWMTESDLRNTYLDGHLVGLHSFSHPTQMSKLSKIEQESEYQRNFEHLKSVLGTSVNVMSHPCGDYNQDTLQILSDMGITLGFRSSMSVTTISSLLEIPREDHANVFKKMNA